MANPLAMLSELGQSPWYDQMTRSLLTEGTLKQMIDEDGLRGLTSNPTIFEKAIAGGTDYEAALKQLATRGASVDEIYDALVVEDIAHAADVFRPLYDRTGGTDGFVSIEVSPLLASDTAGTIAEARQLHARLNRPNVMIKVPATTDGLPAIEQLIADGINVNVTLIFSINVYIQVIETYLCGLERRLAAGQPLTNVASVASFFVSRIDTAVDKLLDALVASGRTEAADLRGRAAIANAKLAYEKFQLLFAGSRWDKLAEQGARVQRPLWASTGTKNPQYSDVLYIESLIGPHTVNTIPPATYAAFRQHGQVQPMTLSDGFSSAHEVFARLKMLGVDLHKVTAELTTAGVKSFVESYNNLIAVISRRRQEVTHA